jgi:hypothetical protein
MAAELLAARTGLIAYRIPLQQGGTLRLMENRINRRILATDITVKSTPFVKTYNGTSLIGSYQVDSEGVIPDSALLLIENGMLRAMMCDRVPTLRVKNPTGNRIYAYQTQGLSARTSPGVLSISTSNGLSNAELKTKLLDAARIEGLDYAYIIRTLPSGNNVFIYKILVEDGSEHLIRAAAPTRLNLDRFKRSLGTSSEKIVVNMIAGGVPISVISPKSMIIEEIDIEIKNLQNTTRLPVVSNPLK